MSISSIPTISRDDLRELLLKLPSTDPARVEEGLQHPHGLRAIVDGKTVEFYRMGDLYEVVENPDQRLGAISKESHAMKPTLLVGPFLTHDGPAPRRPQAPAGGVIEATLAKKGMYLLRCSSRAFDGSPAAIEAHVAATLAKNPGARIASEPVEPHLALTAKLDRITGRAAPEPGPTVLIAANAKPVGRPRIEGTIDRSVIRKERAASEAQAQATHDRVRARQAADPELKASAQRSDGSFYGPDGRTPHQNLSMTRQPEDRDPHPGMDSYRIKDELRPVERALIKGVTERICAVQGCNTRFASATRRLCVEHGYNGGGNLGLKGDSER